MITPTLKQDGVGSQSAVAGAAPAERTAIEREILLQAITRRDARKAVQRPEVYDLEIRDPLIGFTRTSARYQIGLLATRTLRDTRLDSHSMGAVSTS
jgi:hypothetical protein